MPLTSPGFFLFLLFFSFALPFSCFMSRISYFIPKITLTIIISHFQKIAAPSTRPSDATSIQKIFDEFRGASSLSPTPALRLADPTAPDDRSQPDKIGAEGTMRYLQSLSVALDEPALLAVLTQCGAPALSELARDGFVAGWAQRGADTLVKQRAQADAFRGQLRADADFFRAVYRHTFVLGKGAEGPGARAVALDTAVEFWRLLFDADTGWPWRSPDGTAWLAPWTDFLQARWKKSVGRDLWDQTLAFARRTAEDGSLKWWSEDQAWPSVVDEFVEFVKAERKQGRMLPPPDHMEVE